MIDVLPKRKYIRLPLEAYANPASLFYITMDAVERRRLFVGDRFNKEVVAQLSNLARQKQCPVKIYCLMPTHLHLLISPGMVSVVKWVAVFKQRTQYIARQRGISQLWQRSFFDHRVRSNENEADITEYIRTNPVRAGLISHPGDWPWTGSLVW